MIEAVVIETRSIDLARAKEQMADVIDDCLQEDSDTAYLIGLINEGHAPYEWLEGNEELLYATDDPDDEEAILLFVKVSAE